MKLALTSRLNRRLRLGHINSLVAGRGAIFMRPDV